MSQLIKTEVVFPNDPVITSEFVNVYSPYSMSRYKRVNVIFDDSLRYKTLLESNLTIETDNYTSYVVKLSDKNRLDLIAKKFYNDAKLYWVIALFNDMLDPFVVDVGTVLKIPSISSLYKSGGILA